MRLSAYIIAVILPFVYLTTCEAQYLDNFDEHTWQQQDSIITTLFQGRAYSVVGVMSQEAYDREKSRVEKNDAALATFAVWQGIRFILEENQEEAEKYLDEALAIYNSKPDLRNYKYRDALLNKAELSLQNEDVGQAIHYLNDAVVFMTTASEPDKDMYFSTILETFELSLQTQDLENAEAMGRQALSVAQSEYGSSSDQYIQGLSNIGRIYAARGDLRRASNLLLQSYELSKQNLPESSIRRAYYGLAAIDIQEQLGRTQSAENIYNELISLFDRFTHLQEDNIYPTILGRYGKHHEALGNLDEAYQYLNRSNILLTLRTNSTDPIYIQSQSDVGQILVKQAKYTEATGYYEDAIRQARLAYGENSWSEGLLRDRLGALYTEMGRHSAALEQRNKTVEIFNLAIGPNNAQYAMAVLNLGLAHAAADQREKAEVHLISAYQKIKQLYGPNHVRVFNVERYLSDFYTGFDNGKAATHYEAAAKFMVFYYQNLMPLLIDANRLEMESLFDLFWFSYISFINANDLPEETLYHLQDILLQLKPAKHLPTINTMTALINRSDEALMENFRRWQSLRNQIVEFEDETIAGQKESDFDMSQSLEDIKDLSDALFPAYSSSLSTLSEFSLATLTNQLSREEAAIDFFSILSDDDQRQRTYFALITKPGPEVHLVSLQLNQNVLGTNQLQSGTSFYDQIWKPLESHLSNVRKVYISKDGALHKVSLQSIPLPSGEMVGESIEILTRLNLGALKSSSGALQDKYLLVGHPTSSSSDSTSMSAISVPSHMIESPETRKRKPIMSRSASEQEIKVIGNKYAKKKSVTLLAGAEASRSTLIEHIQKERPSLLHLAVPLYFNYPDLASDSTGLSILSKNKQVSTGFALAGAGNSWKADTLRSEVDNGLLSALEINTLDLHNTRLLIWTGAQSTFKEMDGDALYSLQLALKRAGVQSLLMNFWDISEGGKDLYMKELYKNLSKGLTVHDALDKTKSKLRKKVDPSVWSGFVLLE